MDVDKNPTVLATKKRKAADICPPSLAKCVIDSSPSCKQRIFAHRVELNDEDMEDVFDDHEEVDLYDTGKLPHGYVEVIVGPSEDDIEDVAEPIVALEYTR